MFQTLGAISNKQLHDKRQWLQSSNKEANIFSVNKGGGIRIRLGFNQIRKYTKERESESVKDYNTQLGHHIPKP